MGSGDLMKYALNTFNPSGKLILNLLFLIAALLSSSFHTSLSLLFLLIIIGVTGNGFSRKNLLLLIPFSLFAFSLIWMNGLWGASEENSREISVWWMQFSTSGITLGSLLALRVIIIILAGLLFTVSSPPQDLLLSLMQQLSLPPGFAYSVLAVLNLAGDITQDAERMRASHLMRTGKKRNTFTLAIPLLAIHIRRCENISLAMEARGFSMRGKRTFYRKVPWRVRDTLLLLFISSLLLSVFIVSYIKGYPIGYAAWSGYH